MRHYLTRRRRGNLLVVVVLLAIFAAMTFGVMTNAVSNVVSSEERLKSTVAFYDNIAIADVLADAFVDDLGHAWYNRPPQVGETVITMETYEEIIRNISDIYLQITPEGSGYQYVVTNPDGIASFIAFDGPHISPNMRTNFEHSVSKIESFKITTEGPLTAHVADEDNILNNSNGDIFVLEDLYFTLEFAVGVYHYQQEYVIQNMKAEFTRYTEGIDCHIKTDDAIVTMLRQNISAK